MKRADQDALDGGPYRPGFEAAPESRKARVDANSLASLDARIRHAEQAVIRRDEAWLAQVRTASRQGAEAARKGAGWVAGGLALLGLVLLARGVLPSGSRAPDAKQARTGRTGRAEHLPRHARGGPTWATLASVLALATSLLPIGVRGWVAPVAGLVGGGRWGWGRLGATLIERLRRNGFAAPRVAVAPRRSSPQHAAPRRPPVRTMSNVDLGRFAGDWCEIAHFAARVNAACGGAVTSRYQPRGPALAVTRRCVNRRGREIRVHGEARPVAGSAGARLRVTFAPAWLRGMAWIWVDHCILFVDADYQYALVGTPDRAALWLLARTPTLQRSALVELVECAQAQGFDIDRLRRTPPSA